MTPAIDVVKRAGISFRIHEYTTTANHALGREAASALSLPQDRVFKTLVVALDNTRFAVALVPVAGKLSLKALHKLPKLSSTTNHKANHKHASMASPAAVQRITGYVIGGVSPLGQRRKLPTFIDSCAREHDTIFISAGRRGLEMELAATDLAELCGAQFGKLARLNPV
jgi:Cys-tRNA(Pro)/Cys-tRNA(Cys) deacylase